MDIKQSKSKKPMTEKQALQIMTKRKSCIQKYRKNITKTIKKKVKFDKPLEEVREIESNEPVLQELVAGPGIKAPKVKAIKEPKVKAVKEPKVKKVKEVKAKKVKEVKEPIDENQ